MGKRIWIGCVAVVGAWSTLAGCEQSASTTTATTTGGLEPGEAEEECRAAYEACFAESGDEDACREAFRACVGNVGEDGRPHHQGPPPADDPVFQCHDAFRTCIETTDDHEACRVTLDECLAAIPPGQGGPRPPHPPGCEGPRPPDGEGPRPPLDPAVEEALLACRDAFRACLDAGTEPATCEADVRACIEAALPDRPEGEEGNPPPPPEDHAARCQEHFDACVAAGEAADVCQQHLDACLSWDGDRPDGDRPEGDRPGCEHPVGPCQAGFDACRRFASDEAQLAACAAGLEACRANLPQPTGTY